MPCHVETYKPNYSKQEIDKVVEVVNGKIKVKRVGDDYMGGFPTLKELLTGYKDKLKTFHYKHDGTMLVVVSPCPKGC